MEQVSCVRPTGKFPGKVENLKRWTRLPGWNFRTECRVPFTFVVDCTSSRSTVRHSDVPGFTTKWNNFLPIGNCTFAPTEISGFFNWMESAHCFPPKSLIGQHCKIYDRRYSEVYWISSIKVSRALLGKRWHSWETKLTVSLRTTSHQRSNEPKNWDIFFSRFTFTKH